MSACIAGMVCLGFRCRMFGCFRDFGFGIGFPPQQTIGMGVCSRRKRKDWETE